MDQRKTTTGGYGMFTRIHWVIALGILLGIAIGIPLRTTDGWENTRASLAALLASGIGLAYILLSLLDWWTQWRALSANPLPDDLDLSERAVAAEQLTALSGSTILHRHIRRLLAAWSAGAAGPQVATMSGNQMQRMLGMLIAENAAFLALLGAAAGFAAPGLMLTLVSGLMILLLLVAVARLQLATHLAGYIESNLLARIGNDTPAAAAVEFSKDLGKSVADSTAALAAAQAAFADQLVKSQQEAAAQISTSQQEAAAQVSKAQQEASAQIAKTQQEAAAQIAKAQDKVAEQIGRVGEMAASIDKILQIQQAVDGTLKGVAVTDEFKSTLVELKRHLSESDALLKAVSKPRTIRLVEKENE